MVLKLLFKYLLSEVPQFSLAKLNERIRYFNWTKAEQSDVPPDVERSHLQTFGSLKLTAQKSKNLSMRLPALIGDLVPLNDARWKNFLLIRLAYILITSPLASDRSLMHLEYLISAFLISFKEYYPLTNFTPKLHFLLHHVHQIYEFGPGRHFSCKKFERQFGLLKNKKWRNFKNIPLSVAKERELWQTYKICGTGSKISSNCLYPGDLVKNARAISVNDSICNFLPNLETFFRGYAASFDQKSIFQASEVEIHGHTYSAGTILVFCITDIFPEFVKILSVLIAENMKFFIVEKLVTLENDEHYAAYVVNPTGIHLCIPYNKFFYNWPQLKFERKNKLFVSLYGCDSV